MKNAKNDTAIANSTDQEKLDDATLELLGAFNNNEKPGPDLHTAVSDRWSVILKEGFSKEFKEPLMKKYPFPANCPMLKAPLINPEIKSTMTHISMKKDNFQQISQNQLGAAIYAIGSALSLILGKNNDSDNNEIFTKLISYLGDGGRLLSDLHHGISLTRRAFIIPGLNYTAKSVAENSKIDTLLFGQEFSERLKTATAVEKAGKVITRPSTSNRKSSYRNTSTKNTSTTYALRRTNAASNLNPKGPSQKYQKTGRYGGVQKSRLQQIQTTQRHR